MKSVPWARHDAEIRQHLRTLLFSDTEALRRSMAYAIGIAGTVCEPIVMEAMASEDARVRRVGAYAAGEARIGSEAVVQTLFERLEGDADDLVRSNAAYALGLIGRRSATVSPTRLLKRLDPAVEGDNTTNGGMYRSTVRVNVMYALSNLQTLDGAELEAIAEVSLADRDRYVRGLAVALLERHALARGEPWIGKLVAHLTQTRFNDRPPRADLEGPDAAAQAMLTSPANTRVKRVVKLRTRRHRDRERRFVIEGFKELDSASRAGFPVETVFYCEQHFAGRGGRGTGPSTGRRGFRLRANERCRFRQALVPAHAGWSLGSSRDSRADARRAGGAWALPVAGCREHREARQPRRDAADRGRRRCFGRVGRGSDHRSVQPQRGAGKRRHACSAYR